ncbi:MAG: hypothetical protein A2Y78_14645 [Acidobacteria bacterium RBG_13_68_16]|nr:MAG: hypothetical protein A2Y78_14645 [Acidobacteria bacterium RBG_13_68_16]
MDDLHSAIVAAFEKGLDPFRLATALINRKAAEQGLVFSKRHLKKIEACLRAQEMHDFVVRMPGSGPPREFTIELDHSDLQEVERQVESLTERMPDMMRDLCDAVAADLLVTLTNTWPREATHQQREERQFRSALHRKWDVPFRLLGMLITIARGIGGTLNGELRDEGDPKLLNTVEVLTRFQARACQVASEILTLLQGGFADGALARWRTLHEISVLAVFVHAHGESAAESFFAYQPLEKARAAEEYQRSCAALGYESLSRAELESISKRAELAWRRFGRHSKEDYGWAAPFLAKDCRPSFRALQESVGLRHLRPFYKMASDNVHTTPKGLAFALGLVCDERFLLAGPSTVGLADPGQLTGLSLSHVTIILLGLRPTLDSAVASKIVLKLVGEVAEAFCNVEADAP